MDEQVSIPPPMVVGPESGRHKRSLIILHGRGSNGESFGHHLLKTSLPDLRSLNETLPDTRFIFPTAARSAAGTSGQSIINQWFNNWSLDDPSEKEELQFEGLRQSTSYIHSLLETEIKLVGAKNVILWGLSQGCAISLISLLLWNGPNIAAVIGMCGWLPLREHFVEPSEETTGQNDKSFEGDPTSKISCKVQIAREYLDAHLEMKSGSAPDTLTSVPVFLGHGVLDNKVPTHLGREASELLRSLHFDVTYTEYEGLAHWYSPQMLQDILAFIKSKTDFTVRRQVDSSAALPNLRAQLAKSADHNNS